MLVDAAKKVESVVRHEPSAVQGVSEKLSHALGVRLSSVLALIDFDLGDQVFVQDLDIGDHATGSDDTLVGQLGRSAVLTREDGIALRDSGVTSYHDEIGTSDGYSRKVG